MDETHRRTFRPLPEVRWSAVATGALLGAAVWLVLLRFGDVPRALLLEEAPGLGRQLWWVVAPLLAAGVAAWTGASASGERGILGAYLHGLLSWAGALLLAALVGPGSVGVLPQPGWSGLAAVLGAVVGAALGRALLAGRLSAPRGFHGTGRRPLVSSSEAHPVEESGRVSQARSRWREVLTARRGAPEGRRPGAHEDTGRPDQDLH
ncbi:hypothetical protein ATI61_104497 [Archangium gephyra]|uniref:Uncharacterized protein n=1 Tax=Archangium gephyra TaxID=48 RepID=A0AAC8Q2Y0_9BACT|nr:hypothetical protein [Archangium gephyra]AKJ00095.1 Hypothetical protein AA314_01721 [Archangium gephyra]REG33206.1 hypothetical protein ATI61_104497 [Archangium gephyra]